MNVHDRTGKRTTQYTAAECQKAGSENEVVTTAVNTLTCTIFVMGVLDMGLDSASNEGVDDI